MYWTRGTEAMTGEVANPGLGLNYVTDTRYRGSMVAVELSAILADM